MLPSPRRAPVATHWKGVERLAERVEQQQCRANREDRRLGRENPQEGLRDGRDDRRGRHGEDAGEQQRRPAGPPHTGRVCGADRLADADGCGRAQTKRNHEEKPGDVQHDLIRGDGEWRDASRERRGHREHAEFERDLDRSRRAEAHERPGACQLERPRNIVQPGWTAGALGAKHDGEQEQRQVNPCAEASHRRSRARRVPACRDIRTRRSSCRRR